jgi:hypothetical protein
MIGIKSSGNFDKTKRFLNEVSDTRKLINRKTAIKALAEEGLDRLKEATPKRTGLTANSWSYEITSQNGKTSITFNNSNVVKGVNIAIILDYGHGTGTGGYVKGLEYIDPAIRPVFDKMSADMWKAVVAS